MKQQYNAITPTTIVPVPPKEVQYLTVTYLVDDTLQCQIVSNPSNIKAIKIDGGRTKFWDISQNPTLTFDSPGEHIIEFILQDKTTISAGMFYNISDIVDIQIPKEITSIDSGNFVGLSIKSLILPETLTSFVYNFSNLLELEYLEINSPCTINSSFCGSSWFPKLKVIKIGKTAKLGGGCFCKLNKLDQVYIDGEVTSGGNLVGTNIKELIIGDNFKGSTVGGNFNGGYIDEVLVKDVKEIFNIMFLSTGGYPKKNRISL